MHESEIRALFDGAPDAMSAPEVARRLGIKDHQTVHGWIKNRGLPAFQVSGQWRIRTEALVTWLIDQQDTPAP